MNPLQNLKDIHTPESIGNWPPAYGWWLLVLIVILSLFFIGRWINKARKLRQAKRQALAELNQIKMEEPRANSQLNQLLKRAAMSYVPHIDIQAMYGENWTAFLLNGLSEKNQAQLAVPLSALQASLYQKTTDNIELQSYQQAVESWLKHALPPSKKARQKWEQEHA